MLMPVSSCSENTIALSSMASSTVPKISEELLSYISLFGALSRVELDGLLSFTAVRQCRSGERLFEQDDLPSDIFILLKGRVDLVMDRGGITRIYESYKCGDSFGESAVIGIQTQIGSAIASGDNVELLVLSREALMSLHNSDSELYATLMMNIARELSRKLHVQAAS
ncbi:MAG: CRP/FNR family cyclic AMP-dependent transcriptional regulator [Flavobacteriales bacterium]|jgi:CRP/FNR family cyclic AMP-dependent transcriptional regulator